MSTQDASELPDETDVLVVGAGVAGLYCAWRLLDEGKAENVVIVERLNRTGGRLDTDLITLKDASGQVTVRDEEGGMRFNYGMHELMALFGKLGLCDDIEPFPMAPDGPNDNRYFMRGSAFTQAEATADPNKWSELYQLDERERGKSPVTIINDVYTAIQKANPQEAWPANPTPADWQRFRLHFRWKGTPLNEWQLWGLLRDMGYSEECITMLSHAVGFEGPFLSLANAGEAFQILEDFPKNPQYYTFRKGYSTLPNKLRELIKGHHGGQIFLGVNVEAIHPSRDGFDVTLTVAPPGRSSSRFVEHGVTRHIRAPKVILAVATKALTHLYASSPVFHDSDRAEQISNDLQSVVNMRLMKINLYFETAWWEDETIVNPPVQIGPSFTDLPVNSVYPFYSVTTAGTSDAKSRPAALTIYCDFNNTNFWEGLQHVGPAFSSPQQKEHSRPPQVLFPASVAVVDEVINQLRLVFSAEDIPQPMP